MSSATMAAHALRSPTMVPVSGSGSSAVRAETATSSRRASMVRQRR
jgi:hypothetical protein